MGDLMMVPRKMGHDDDAGVLMVIDMATRQPVGEVIPSDDYPGRWRADVFSRPGRGTGGFVCVTERGETLVDRSSPGTDRFRNPNEAMEAIARNRLR